MSHDRLGSAARIPHSYRKSFFITRLNRRVAIRRFLTEALKKEEKAPRGEKGRWDRDRARAAVKEREREVYWRRNGVSRDRTRGRVVIPDRLIYVYIYTHTHTYTCVRLSVWYTCRIDRFLASFGRATGP